MPEEYGERGERGDDRDRGDRDRDRWPDVKPERPGKTTIEACEDVQGLLRTVWDMSKDVFREKATMEGALGVYDRVLAQREI